MNNYSEQLNFNNKLKIICVRECAEVINMLTNTDAISVTIDNCSMIIGHNRIELSGHKDNIRELLKNSVLTTDSDNNLYDLYLLLRASNCCELSDGLSISDFNTGSGELTVFIRTENENLHFALEDSKSSSGLRYLSV